jgi:hypothetical protein
MNISVQHISNYFDNEWGFYVDLESLNPILLDDKYYGEPLYDEAHFVADYYYEDDICDENVYSFDDNETDSKINEFGAYVVQVGSTTIITAVLTYAVLFIL